MQAYSGLARLYDKLTFDINYDEWVSYIEKIFKKHGVSPGLVLELACGTGNIALRMAQKGYDMIGADLSCDMLNVAQNKAAESNLEILLLNQDMTDYELYGTVDVVLCLLDSVNYITEYEDLKKFFSLARNYLNPGGLLIFDINSEYKLSEILGNNTFSYEKDDIFYVWQNEFDKSAQLCSFYLTFFEKDGEKYNRYDEAHVEKAYSVPEMSSFISETGLKLEGCYSGLSFEEPNGTCERIFFVSKRI